MTALNQVVDRVGKVLVHLDEGTDDTASNASGGKKSSATSATSPSGVAVFALSPMEHMQLMNVALAAVSSDTANDVREKALALFLKLLRLFPTMHVDATLHIVSYIRIALTHASMGVRRAGLKMLGEFILAWPGAIRNAFYKEQTAAGSKTAAAVASMTAAAAAVASTGFGSTDASKKAEDATAEEGDDADLAPQTTMHARTTMIEQIVDWATQLAVNAKVMHQHILLPPLALLLEECLPIDMSTSINKVLACGHFAANSHYSNLLIQQKKFGSGSTPQYNNTAGGQQEHHRQMYEAESRVVLEMLFARLPAAASENAAKHHASKNVETASVGFVSASDPSVTPTTTSMGCGGILSPWFVQFYFNKFQSKLALSWKELMELQHKIFRDTTIALQRALMIARWFTCAGIYLKRNNLLSKDQSKTIRELFVNRVPFTLKDLVLRDRKDDSSDDEAEEKGAVTPVAAEDSASEADVSDGGANDAESESESESYEEETVAVEVTRADEKLRQRKLSKMARRMGISVVDLGGKYVAPSTIAGAKRKRRLQGMVAAQSTSMNPSTAKQIAAIEPMKGKRAGRGKVYNNLAGPELFIARGNTLATEREAGSAGKSGVALSSGNATKVGDSVKTNLSSLNHDESLTTLNGGEKSHRLFHRQLAEAICWCLVPIASASEGHFINYFNRLLKQHSSSSKKTGKTVAKAEEEEQEVDGQTEEESDVATTNAVDDIKLQELGVAQLQTSFETRDLIKGVLSHFLDNIAYERSVEHHLSAVTTAITSASAAAGAVLPYLTKSASSANSSLSTVHEALTSMIAFFETALGLFPQLHFHWASVFEKVVVERVFYALSTETTLQVRYQELMQVLGGANQGSGAQVIEVLALNNARRNEIATRNFEGTLRLLANFMRYAQRLTSPSSSGAASNSHALKNMREVLSNILVMRLPRLLFSTRGVLQANDASLLHGGNITGQKTVLADGNTKRFKSCIHGILLQYLHAVRDQHMALSGDGVYQTLTRALTPVCMGLTNPTTGAELEGPIANCADETRLVAEHLFFYLRQHTTSTNASATAVAPPKNGVIACAADMWLLTNFNTALAAY